MARTLNGNLTGAAAHGSENLTRPTDEILNFIKAHAEPEEYQRRFNSIYDSWRNVDYKIYVNELRAWRQEIAEALEAKRPVRGPVRWDRGRGTGSLVEQPTYRELVNGTYGLPMQAESLPDA